MDQQCQKSGPIAFGSGNDLFGWLHAPASPQPLPAIVLCSPVGYELIRTHRTIRQLAENLAARGYCVLRFDYRSTGDSAGDELDSGRLDAMLYSIRESIRTITEIADTDRVSLIGLRLGATLAAKIAEETPLEQLVLWAPCASGAIYIREQQIMAMAQGKRLQSSSANTARLDGIDAGGFFLSKETQTELQTLDMGSQPFANTPSVLLLNRDDIPVPASLANALRNQTDSVDEILSAHYKEMMQTPQVSVVPTDTIEQVCSWLDDKNAAQDDAAKSAPKPTSKPAEFPRIQLDNGASEHAVRFGPGKRLFGIITRDARNNNNDSPAVILLCGGATHRISANRMYVTLARRLALGGIDVMRMDLAGLGDSLPHEGYPSNKPYNDKLVDDVEAAMNTMEELTGKKQFLLFGLCSGAYAAMQTAMSSTRVTDLVLANQLVYFVSEDYHKRLASGAATSAHELDYPRSDSLLYRLVRKTLRRITPYWSWPGELLSPYLLGGNVRRDLELLATKGTRFAFIQSSRSDAADALSFSSGKWLRQLAERGQASITLFDDTDHTFSPTRSQQALVDWFEAHMATRARQ